MNIEDAKNIPIYKQLVRNGEFPILEKPVIAKNFPDGWITPIVKKAIENGDAEFVKTTGTNHDRMQLIRPPFFLLKTYFKIWQQHQDTKSSWNEGCMRISLTTIRATQHVSKSINPSTKERTFGDRTLYINLKEDPHDWDEHETQRMCAEITERSPYHLDCDAFYAAQLIKKLKQYNLSSSFPKPRTIIHAYELCTQNVKRYVQELMGRHVVNLFGSTELGYMFSSGSDNIMRPHLDGMDIELVPVEDGSSILSLIVTSTRNPYMPLIRYRSGDCVQTTDGSLSVDKIYRVCGREKELYRRNDGAPIAHAMFDDIVSEISHNIFIYQLRILNASEGCLFYCTFDDEQLDRQQVSDLQERCREILDLKCKIVYQDNIPPGGSGKYAWLSYI